MDTKLVGGTAFGVPVAGGIVSLDSAETGAILSAATGLAKTMFFVGSGLALAAGLAAVFLNLRSNEDVDRLFLNVMAKIKTKKRDFKGICIDDKFDFLSEEQELSIPVEFIKSIDYKSPIFGDSELLLTLFDGSSYSINRYKTGPLNFLTIAGKQQVVMGDLCDISKSIKGNTVEERDALISNVNDFLEIECDSMVKILGKPKFEKFFYHGK